MRPIRPFTGPPTCGSPEKSENTMIVGSKRTIGSTIDYVCPDGYMLIGSKSRMCEPSGFWSGDVPTCKCECNVQWRLKEVNARVWLLIQRCSCHAINVLVPCPFNFERSYRSLSSRTAAIGIEYNSLNII